MKFNGDAKTVRAIRGSTSDLATLYIASFKQYADELGYALGDGIQLADIGLMAAIAVKLVEDARNIHMLKGAEKKELAIALVKKVIEIYGLKEIYKNTMVSVFEILRRIIKANGILGGILSMLLTQKRWDGIVNAVISMIIEYVLSFLKSQSPSFNLKAFLFRHL